jgi:hypothetical protein
VLVHAGGKNRGTSARPHENHTARKDACDVSGTDHARPGPVNVMECPGRRLAGHSLIQLGKAVDVCLYRELKAHGCDAAAELDHVHRR